MPTYGIAFFPQYAPPDFTRLCQQVEDGGFAHLWVPDERFFRDVAVQLTLAATHTRRITIGSAVTDPFVRHPALTASLMATLDELCGGRLVMGIGAGVSGFEAMGVKREKPALALREGVALMRALWQGGPVTFAGKSTSFRGGRLEYGPARPGGPRIWIASRGPAILRLAGEVGDGALIGALASEPGLRYAHTHIDAGLQKAGRDPKSLTRALWLHTAVAEDGEAARAAVRNIVAGVLISSRDVLADMGIPIPEALLKAMEGVTYGVNNPEMQRVARLVDDAVLRHFSVAGTPAEVRARMAELGRMGIDHVAVVPWVAQGQTIDQFIGLLAGAVTE